MARISLCLIARDEELMLPGCLASVRGAVDEIVLVDTGSADRTLEIARGADAVVVEQPWHDDFAAPRNEALARATGDYVLQLDCDERLAPGAAAALRKATRTGVELGMLRLHNAARVDAPLAEVLSGRARIADPLLLPRLFRRHDGVSYRGLIHESPTEWFAERRIAARLIAADIVHLGYAADARSAAGKHQRNLELLARACAIEPENITPLGYLAVEHYTTGDLVAALEASDRGWPLVDQQPTHRSAHRLLVMRAVAALQLGQPAKALETADKLLSREGPSSDGLLLRGSALLALAEAAADRNPLLEASALTSRQALARCDASEANRLIAGAATWRAALQLGQARLAAGSAAEAATIFQQLLSGRPEEREGRLGLAEAWIEQGASLQALELLEPLLDEQPDGWLLAAAAAWSLKANGDARLFLLRAQERAARGLGTWQRRQRFDALSKALEQV